MEISTGSSTNREILRNEPAEFGHSSDYSPVTERLVSKEDVLRVAKSAGVVLGSIDSVVDYKGLGKPEQSYDSRLAQQGPAYFPAQVDPLNMPLAEMYGIPLGSEPKSILDAYRKN